MSTIQQASNLIQLSLPRVRLNLSILQLILIRPLSIHKHILTQRHLSLIQVSSKIIKQTRPMSSSILRILPNLDLELLALTEEELLRQVLVPLSERLHRILGNFRKTEDHTLCEKLGD